MGISLPRPMKGTRISDFYPVKQVPPLASIDSAFQLQEYISILIRHDVHDVETIVSLPGRQGTKEREGSDDMRGESREVDKESKGDVIVDESCWIYEQLRRLAQDLSHPLITTLQQECTRATCPEMKAGEWMYLCVAHGNDGSMEQCCAIDYILHTLDSATALLNSPRAFPSRLSIPPPSQRHFPSLARRLGRIFAHAYYHHREAFEQAEAESSLYARFLALTSKFELVPAEFLVIPSSMQVMHEDGDRERGRDTDTRDNSDVRGMSEFVQDRDGKQWLGQNASLSAVDLNDGRRLSPPGPAGEARNPSPRKGRSRTDTMVYSEAANVVEELAKGEDFSEADLDRAIAQERMLTAVPPRASEPPQNEVEGEAPLATPEISSREDSQATIRYPDTDVPRDVQLRILMRQMQSAEPTEPETTTLPAEESEVTVAESVVQAESESDSENVSQPPEEENHPQEEPALALDEQKDLVEPAAPPEDESVTVETQQEDETKAVTESEPTKAEEPSPGSAAEQALLEDEEPLEDSSAVVSSEEPEQTVDADTSETVVSVGDVAEEEPSAEVHLEAAEEPEEPLQAPSAQEEEHQPLEPSDIPSPSEVVEEHETPES